MDLHLVLMREMSCVLLVDSLVFLMKLILIFHCLVPRLDEMMGLFCNPLWMILMELNIVCFMFQNWVSHLDVPI